MTPNQKKILSYIETYSTKHGYAPSQREIMQYMKLKSPGTIAQYIKALKAGGHLVSSQTARGLELNQTIDAIALPLLGKVAAGFPIEAVETRDTLEVPRSMVRSGEHIALRVSGSSMIEDAILDGDFVVIRKQATAHNGETVVALLENEATIKRFYQKQNAIELHPANPQYPVIHVPKPKDFRILGVLVGVIRKL